MKEIIIPGRNIVALVDDEDYDILISYKWTARYTRGLWYIKTYINGCAVHMERIILKITDPSIQVDHIDNNTFNNQKSNLRPATHTQNLWNRRKYKNSKSKYKGVYRNVIKYKETEYLYWTAAVYSNGKRHYIGQYNTEEEAALAYNDKAKEHHGEFAKLNVIDKQK